MNISLAVNSIFEVKFDELAEKVKTEFVKNVIQCIFLLVKNFSLDHFLKFKTFIKFAYHFFCLTRGVKNSRSLLELKKFMSSKINTKRKADAMLIFIKFLLFHHV